MIAVSKNQKSAAVTISPGTPNAILEIDRNPAPPIPSSSTFVCSDAVEANQLASRVTNDVTNVNAQQQIKPKMDGINPAPTVSAGSAIIPAPMAVPANRSDAPAMLPSSASVALPSLSIVMERCIFLYRLLSYPILLFVLHRRLMKG